MQNARWRLYLPVIAPVTTVSDAECSVAALPAGHRTGYNRERCRMPGGGFHA
jgi:hypothetical protein